MLKFADKARTLTLAVLLGTAMVSHSALAHPVTVKHAKGELTFETAPKRVAVFDLASLDVLNALGVSSVAGVPKDKEGGFNSPAYLQKYAASQYVGVGTLFEPDMATLKELKPDLIIISGRSAGKYDEVSKIAPTIDMSPKGDNLVDDSVTATETLARLFDVKARGDEKIAALKTAVSTMHKAAPANDTALVLFTVGENVMVHAPGARFGTLYDFVGLKSAVPPMVPQSNAGPRPAAGSPEAEAARKRQIETRDAALAKNPDWIITLDRGAISSTGPSDIDTRLGKIAPITATSAWKAGKVYHLDPRAWYLVGHGIDNLTQTAVALGKVYEGKE